MYRYVCTVTWICPKDFTNSFSGPALNTPLNLHTYKMFTRNVILEYVCLYCRRLSSLHDRLCGNIIAFYRSLSIIHKVYSFVTKSFMCSSIKVNLKEFCIFRQNYVCSQMLFRREGACLKRYSAL